MRAGFGEEPPSHDDEDAPAAAAGSRLSDQLKSYYAKHLDPTKGPEGGMNTKLHAVSDADGRPLSFFMAE